MKNLKIKKALKKLIMAGTISFVLITTGCSNKENDTEIKNEVTTEIENNNNTTNTTETTENNDIVNTFENKEEEIDSLIYTGGIDAANQVWSEFFIDAVDIIFYDKEYAGTKFSELNPEAQQECLNIINDLGNKMNEINPNWQEDLGTIKDSTASTYYEILSYIEELIGTENYNNIKNIKDSLKEGASEIGNTLKNDASEWYQNYKNNQK